MSKTILTKEQENDIIYKYSVLGISKNKLRLEYNVSEGCIKRCLQRNGIHIRQVEETNISKYSIDESFFEYNKQNSQSAYILGLFASDGTVAKNENMMCIELQQADKEVLEQVNSILRNERPVKDYICGNGYKNSKLYFYSKKMKQDLAFYDIIPNKTYEAKDFIKNIKPEYFWDFIRGFWDGDGSVTNTNGTIRWQLDGVCLETFEHIQEILSDQYGIEVKIVYNLDERSTVPKYRLYCYSQNKCCKIFNHMYKDENCIKLHRKYNRFLELLK